MDDILRLINDWRAARRAAVSDDYEPFRAVYVRNTAAYALVIRSRVRR